ncbi:NFX1-type zinc finger-containing protein 1 [Desmophyllum pertusum]|uniref:NFX1-type zinc finger-containing protein 1 n=1 Tax=Desmophyllum pertusum TaxID=174260 RepID=A0A9X0CEC2_9CNID|nr:NFX1-type zinc finger-containing protein 1 [Desmophyllum pertusum]
MHLAVPASQMHETVRETVAIALDATCRVRSYSMPASLYRSLRGTMPEEVPRVSQGRGDGDFLRNEDEPDARFVELADCGHVFEVEMMDQWMDQAETTDGGKAC